MRNNLLLFCSLAFCSVLYAGAAEKSFVRICDNLGEVFKMSSCANLLRIESEGDSFRPFVEARGRIGVFVRQGKNANASILYVSNTCDLAVVADVTDDEERKSENMFVVKLPPFTGENANHTNSRAPNLEKDCREEDGCAGRMIRRR